MAETNHLRTVWAGVGRYPYWPGVVKDPSSLPENDPVRNEGKDGQVLVHFFGTYDYSWVNPTQTLDFREAFDDKSKKNRAKSFKRAIEEANSYLDSGEVPEGFKNDTIPEDIDEVEEEPVAADVKPTAKRSRSKKQVTPKQMSSTKAKSRKKMTPEEIVALEKEQKAERRRERMRKLGLIAPLPFLGKQV
eukprot:Clim_evm30s55 gene=Clim_evmTU30s55